MMERSSRFISLSGLSGIAAGCCGLAGAWFANGIIEANKFSDSSFNSTTDSRAVVVSVKDWMGNSLFQVAIFTFAAAFILAFLFTWIRSKKTNVPIWGSTARRLMVQVLVPMAAGGIFLLALMNSGAYGYIAPGCLIFYGIAVLNASKYTLPETAYLGYAEILLGIMSLFFIGNGLYFWAVGFGLFHIIYGLIMWRKYESGGDNK